MGRKKAPAELVSRIHDCAADEMSMTDAAAQLTSRAYPLTRNAVAGIANRNGIKFKAPPDPGRVRQRTKRAVEALAKEFGYVNLDERRNGLVLIYAMEHETVRQQFEKIVKIVFEASKKTKVKKL